MKKVWIALLAAAVLALIGAPSAHAAGSDGIPPYEVGFEGLTLPDGDTFQANGHVNIKYTDYDGGNAGSAGIHFDPNNGHPGGQWIGENFIPWTAFGLTSNFCITWVQVHGYNEHFGEGSHKSVCVPPVTPCEEDQYAPGCEIPPAPEPWVTFEERTNPMVCETGATGYGTITSERRDGVREHVWNEDGWTWVLPLEWTWTDWYVTSEERVKSGACDPLPETGGESLTPLGVAGFVLVAGGILLLTRRKTA